MGIFTSNRVLSQKEADRLRNELIGLLEELYLGIKDKSEATKFLQDLLEASFTSIVATLAKSCEDSLSINFATIFEEAANVDLSIHLGLAQRAEQLIERVRGSYADLRKEQGRFAAMYTRLDELSKRESIMTEFRRRMDECSKLVQSFDILSEEYASLDQAQL